MVFWDNIHLKKLNCLKSQKRGFERDFVDIVESVENMNPELGGQINRFVIG